MPTHRRAGKAMRGGKTALSKSSTFSGKFRQLSMFGDEADSKVSIAESGMRRVYWAGGRYELTTISDARLVAVLPGDFNADGTVDAADYLLWRKGGGTSTSYEAWRGRFG